MSSVYPAPPCPEQARICKACGEAKPLTEYYPHAASHGGYQTRCKACVRGRRFAPPPPPRPTDAEMRALPLDEFARWMLDHGWYDVDMQTGIVTNVRTGFVLKASPRGPAGRDYRAVSLVFSGKVIRSVKVHRLIAVKVWGVGAIRGKEIGHKDGNRYHNSIDNFWLPDSRREHANFDNSGRGLVRREAKTSWSPCVRCGDPDGQSQPDCVTPVRISGARYGIAGQLCRRCYGTLGERARRAKQKGQAA